MIWISRDHTKNGMSYTLHTKQPYPKHLHSGTVWNSEAKSRCEISDIVGKALVSGMKPGDCFHINNVSTNRDN